MAATVFQLALMQPLALATIEPWLIGFVYLVGPRLEPIMRRRTFITLLGSAMLSRAHAQPSMSRKVGGLFPGVLGDQREKLILAGITSEMASENVILVTRSAEGNPQLLTKYANELVAR